MTRHDKTRQGKAPLRSCGGSMQGLGLLLVRAGGSSEGARGQDIMSAVQVVGSAAGK